MLVLVDTVCTSKKVVIFRDEGIVDRIIGRAGKFENGRICKPNVMFGTGSFESVDIEYGVGGRRFKNDLSCSTQIVN
jgi:hypothetical protein